MTKRFRKLLSILCALAMLICVFPAFAEEENTETPSQPETPETAETVEAESPGEEDSSGTQQAVVEDLEELPETDPEPSAEPEEEQPEQLPEEPSEEIASDAMTIEEALEEEPEEEAEVEPQEPIEEPAEVPEAGEPAPPAEEPAKTVDVQENNPPADEAASSKDEPKEDKQEENGPESKPEEQQEEPEAEEQEEETEEEEPDEESEEILLNLNGQTSISGELTRETPFTFTASDDYFRTVVFTLTVQKEDSITVIRGENSIPLTKIVNSDPNSTDILYTFERETVAGQMYTYILKTEDAGLISFAIDISEKTEETVNNEAINQEQTEVQENTDGISSEVTEESLDENKEENDELPTERKIEVAILWDEEHPTYGATAHFVATLMGYEGLEYTMQWQWSENDVDWYNVEGATEDHLDVVYSEENGDYNWRILVDVVTP